MTAQLPVTPANPVGTPEGGSAAVPGTETYNEQMTKIAAAQDGVNENSAPPAIPDSTQSAPQEPSEQREDWLPEGINSREELLEAYEKLKGASKPEPSPTQDNQKADGSLGPAQVTDRAQLFRYLDSKGVSLDTLETEYLTSGKLSEDSYTKLGEAGIPRIWVDNYIQGQQALAAQMTAEVQSEVGGADAYREMAEWAAKTLTPQELAAYNAIMDSYDKAAIVFAVKGLQSRYLSSTKEAPLIMGDAPAKSSGVFESEWQMVEAMKDPRYETDPAYREAVMKKVLRSTDMKQNFM